MTPTEQKEQLRQQAKQALGRLTVEARRSGSADLVERCLSAPEWETARRVLLFAPLRDEPDVISLVSNALASGKLVTLPRFDATRGIYEAAELMGWEKLSPPGPFGVREPAGDCPVVALNQLDLALVPGIAFDLSGRRLGRGKGFYDRLLAEFTGTKCGIAFDCQVLTALPDEPHDVTLNCLLTPTRWLRFSSAPRL